MGGSRHIDHQGREEIYCWQDFGARFLASGSFYAWLRDYLKTLRSSGWQEDTISLSLKGEGWGEGEIP